MLDSLFLFFFLFAVIVVVRDVNNKCSFFFVQLQFRAAVECVVLPVVIMRLL